MTIDSRRDIGFKHEVSPVYVQQAEKIVKDSINIKVIAPAVNVKGVVPVAETKTPDFLEAVIAKACAGFDLSLDNDIHEVCLKA